MKHSHLKGLNCVTGDAEPIKDVHAIRTSTAGNHHHRSFTLLETTMCRHHCTFSKEVNLATLGLEKPTLFARTVASIAFLSKSWYDTNYTAYL